MEVSGRRTRGVQVGPRSRQVIDRVLDATLSELDRAGYAGLTIDSVARLANVSRTTIYRRWPKKRDLVAALLEQEVSRVERAPADGPLAMAVASLIQRLADNLATREGKALAAALTTADPELIELSLAVRRRVLDVVLAPFRKAVARGELSPDADIEMMAHLTFYGCVHWVLEHDGTLTAPDLARLVAAITSIAAISASAQR